MGQSDVLAYLPRWAEADKDSHDACVRRKRMRLGLLLYWTMLWFGVVFIANNSIGPCRIDNTNSER